MKRNSRKVIGRREAAARRILGFYLARFYSLVSKIGNSLF